MAKKNDNNKKPARSKTAPANRSASAPDDSICMVERQTFGLVWTRRLAACLGFISFLLPPLLVLPYTLSSGWLESGDWTATVRIGCVMLLILVSTLLGFIPGLACHIGLPNLYLRCVPTARQPVTPSVGPEGLDLSPFGRFAWSDIRVDYPCGGTWSNRGVGIFPSGARPLLIIHKDDAANRELLNDLQARLPPTPLPYIDDEGIVRDASGKAMDIPMRSLHGGGDVLYPQSETTVLHHIEGQRRLLLHYSGKDPKQQRFIVGLVHLALGIPLAVCMSWLFDPDNGVLRGHLSLALWFGLPLFIISREMFKSVPGSALTQWIDLDRRVVCVRDTEFAGFEQVWTQTREYSLDEFILVSHQHEWDNGCSRELGLALKTAPNTRPPNVFASCFGDRLRGSGIRSHWQLQPNGNWRFSKLASGPGCRNRHPGRMT